MKNYWIVVAVLVSAWPASSKAYVTGQSKSDEKPAQQTSSSNTSTRSQISTQAQAAPKATTTPQNKSSFLLVELSKTLKANKLKPGDKVKAEVSQDVISHGKIIIPAETEVVGHVTEVNPREGGKGESRLGIVFDRILLKHFHDINFQAVVQAVRPPVIRRSRVDEPSQMLPPSIMMGNIRGSSPNPSTTGRSSGLSGGRVPATPPPSGAVSDPTSVTSMQTPLTVKQSPSTNVATGSSAANLEPQAGGTALDVSTPQGVFGLKGLSLSPGATASTPGPVIVSNTENVKLESGTQILLHVLSVEAPQVSKN
jgi:hypothetical protein